MPERAFGATDAHATGAFGTWRTTKIPHFAAVRTAPSTRSCDALHGMRACLRSLQPLAAGRRASGYPEWGRGAAVIEARGAERAAPTSTKRLPNARVCDSRALRTMRAPTNERAAMKTTAPWWITTCLISAVFAGCSSSNTDTNGTTPPPTGIGGFGATGLAGASAGAGGGSGVPPSVPCGATTCTNPAGAILMQLKQFLPSAMLATPCCDAATTTCGWVTSTGTCTVPPPKKNCPAPAAIPGFGGGLSACCNASNTCGIDAYAIGMGCMASFGGGPAANCDTGVAPMTSTAGSSAAGTTAVAGTGAAGAHAGAGGGSAGAAAGSGAAGSAGAHAGSGGSSGAAGHSAGAGGH